jgi:DNA-binding MarR family transcriptional regulator
MSTTETLSPDETQAYELITARDGLLQSELWKALDATSRKGSRLATSLEEKGLIERAQTTHNGQRTYLLTPTNGRSPAATEPESESDSESDSPEDVPTDEPAEDLEAREARALALIQERGEIYQSEFWKELDVSSRTGSRIATRLAEAEAIRREEATYNGRRTYLLRPARKDLDFSLLMAGNSLSPLVGTDGDIDPIEAEAFTQWLFELTQEER